jgi:hypothetical protein
VHAKLGGNAAQLVGEPPGRFRPAGGRSISCAHKFGKPAKQFGGRAGPFLHAVGESAHGARHERVFKLSQRRFAAIVVVVREQRPVRPPQCSADGLAEGGEVRHARQLRQTAPPVDIMQSPSESVSGMTLILS